MTPDEQVTDALRTRNALGSLLALTIAGAVIIGAAWVVGVVFG